MQSMKKLTKRNIFIIVSSLLLITAIIVFLQIRNKPQEDIKTDTESITKEDLSDLHQEYIDWAAETGNEYLSSVLENVNDVVEVYDWSNLEKITPQTELPEIDLSGDQNLFFDINSSNRLEINYAKPTEYESPLMYIYMEAKVMFNGQEFDEIMIKETGDFKGRISLHIYNDQRLKYPMLIWGNAPIASYRDEKVVYFLINDELVKYDIKYGEDINETIRSTVNIDLYIEEDTPYLFTYWEDPALAGIQVTKWELNHDLKQVERTNSVLSIERFFDQEL
jgi:hypothetical protein